MFLSKLINRFHLRLVKRRTRPASCSSTGCARDTNIWQRFFDKKLMVLMHGCSFCFPECAERELLRRLKRAPTVSDQRPVNSRRVPLGLLILSRGEVTAEQLRHALELQRRNGTGRIGDWLQQLGYAQGQSVASALASQWSCPSIKTIPAEADACTIPFYLMRKFRMAPVHFSSDRRMLHIAFAERIEYQVLFAIEQVLNCKTEACFATFGEVKAALDRIEEKTPRGEHLFENVSGPEEITRIISGYAAAMHATEIRLACFAELFWARIEGNGLSADLLFLRTGEKSCQFTTERMLEEFPAGCSRLNRFKGQPHASG